MTVAVGVIFDAQGRVLVGQRTVQDRYFEQWEFPGGKLEPGEMAESALVRELNEELGINVQKVEALMNVEHEYPDRHVDLRVFRVLKFSGSPVGREAQALQWLQPARLGDINFLEGNQKIVQAVQELTV